MTIRPLVDLLAVKKKKENKGSINEEIHTQVPQKQLFYYVTVKYSSRLMFCEDNMTKHNFFAFSLWIIYSRELKTYVAIMDTITGKTSTRFHSLLRLLGKHVAD